MASQLYCPEDTRRTLVRADGTLNGIDYIEVLDLGAPSGVPRQRTLLVHCFLSVRDLTQNNVRIDGGIRITPVQVIWARSAARVLMGEPNPEAAGPLTALLNELPDPLNVLVVRTDANGDYSTYTLTLLEHPATAGPLDGFQAPEGFDSQLAVVGFSFKVECPSDFDCRTDPKCVPTQTPAPPIDYLAKDYSSFRRLMLDRLAVTLPAWRSRSAADLGVVVVELLAYAADQLSYFQDAVATEAYLGTARRRVSVRRHARLVDYFMHDGANARAWVHLHVDPGSAADGATLAGAVNGLGGTTILTATERALSSGESAAIQNAGGSAGIALEAEASERAGAVVFETMHDVTVHAAHNEIRIHTWGDDRCCLPKGATRATVRASTQHGDVQLQAGDLLLFEEVRSPATGAAADADPQRRHVVRLTAAAATVDKLFTDPNDANAPLRLLELEWALEDALPFALHLDELVDAADPNLSNPASVARANIVLADHGRTISDEELSELTDPAHYRPFLTQTALTRQGRVKQSAGGDLVRLDLTAPAVHAFLFELRDARPAIELRDPLAPELVWDARADLLASDRFATEIVVETEEDGTAFLRFGDGISGRLPSAGLHATYRVGNGVAGNVGAESLTRVLGEFEGISTRNPLPARGGAAAESMEEVRLYAPQAFRTQERAVTEADYAAVAERHSQVQKAAATRRWTGSWYTMFITVDRLGGCAVDDEFARELRDFIERFRMAGYDLEIDAPRFVPLDVALRVCVKPDAFRSDVQAALLEVFSNRNLADGVRGFFHPDNYTFGQTVYLSQIIGAAMQVAGVEWVQPLRFQRWGRVAANELQNARVEVDRLEIARLDNDPSLAENGRLELRMAGGL